MHHALCISEVLREILVNASQLCVRDRTTNRVCVWHLCGDESAHCLPSCKYHFEAWMGRPTPRHAFLLTAALCCKTFSSVALDLLWRVIDSLEPFRSLLSSCGSANADSQILKERIARHRMYASRIRGIQVAPDTPSNQFAAEDCSRTWSYTPVLCDSGGTRRPVSPGPLGEEYYSLYRLRSLRIYVHPTSNHQRPLVLLTTALTDVRLNFVGEARHWSRLRALGYVGTYMDALAKQPDLRVLELNWLPVVPDAAVLTHLAGLRTLKVALLASIADSVPLLAALHESEIPDLRVFVEQPDCDSPVVDYRRAGVGSPVELDVRGDPDALCLKQILGLFSCVETELHLTCDFEGQQNHWHFLVDAVLASALGRALRHPHSSLEFAMCAPEESSISDPPFTFSSIRPLLPLRCMRRFELSICASFSFSDADIDALARAWPALEVLELRLYHDALQGCGVLPTRCPTLLSLVSLAKHCRALREAYLPFRARVEELNPADLPAHGHGNRSLGRLILDGGEVQREECLAVAVVLQRLYPVAAIDGQNVFDRDCWDLIIQEKLRCRLYMEMTEMQ